MKLFGQKIESMASNEKYHFPIFLIVLLVLVGCMMVSYYPLHPGHDAHFHFRRLNALIEAMANGRFPFYVDYGVIDGYGYLTKAFYSDFVLIPFALIGLVSNTLVAYQSVILVTTMLSGIFTYKAINTIYKNSLAAFTSGILYSFALYRLLDIYHRGAMGEAISFTFVPIVILGLYYIIKGDCRKWYILAIGFSLMIFTHVISTILMAITVVIILAIYYKTLLKEPKRILWLVVSAGVTLVVTAYYLYPMIEQMLDNTFYYNTRQTMGLAQDSGLGLNWIMWGLFAGVVQPLQIFMPATGIVLTLALLLRIFVRGKSKMLRSADIAVVIGLFFMLAATNLFPWSWFPFNQLNFIQLPWRLYEFSSFFFAMAGGYYLSQTIVSNRRKLILVFLLLGSTVFVMVSDGKLFKETRNFRSIIEEATFENGYQLGGFEYIPSQVPSIEYLHNRGDKIMTHKTETKVSDCRREKDVVGFEINSPLLDVVELPLIYYKGYTATLDGKEIGVRRSCDGLVEIPFDNQSGQVEVYYGGTSVQTISFYITILSIIILIFYILRTNEFFKYFDRKRK